jgi:maleylacetate reductase
MVAPRRALHHRAAPQATLAFANLSSQPMTPFTYNANPARVIFGNGSLQQLGAEIERLGAQRALILSTPEQAESAAKVAAQLGDRACGVFARAVMHVPIETAREAREEARRLGADCAVALGGGSTTGLGKAIALDSGLPIIAIPTTYAGSEVTAIYGLTEGGIKKTGRDPRVLPKTVIYDPELTLSLPYAMSVTSAFNAIAHAAEALYAPDTNPVINLMAQEGLRACAAALAPLQANPLDLAARSDALYGAWLCGTVLGAITMGLHHKLCHTVGGSFNLPHAETHTVVLPHALAYNAPATGPAMERMARALGVAGDAPAALQALAKKHGAPTSLAALGLPESALDRVTDLAVLTPYPNPRALERKALRALLQRAFEGAAPTA